MANMLAEFVIKDHAKMKGRRMNWDSHWQEVTEYYTPNKRNVFDYRTQPGGEKRMSLVYDSTGIVVVQKLASALQGMLTNPSTQWFGLSSGNAEIDNIDGVRAWTQKAVRRMIEILNNSNFQTQIHEVYEDIASIGTASMRIEEDDDTIVSFHARPIYEHYIKENYKGMVDTISREIKYTSRQIKQRYKLNKLINKLDEFDKNKLIKFDSDPDKEWMIVHYIAPRSEFSKEDLKGLKSSFKWISVHVCEDLNIPLEITGFEEFPYVVPRWTKTSDEEYGRSPAMMALPDVKMINKVMQSQIRAVQKIVDPPLQAPDDGIVLPIKTTPNGINYYRAGTSDRIEPMQLGGRPDIGQEFMDDIRQRIRDAFFIDQLQLTEGPQMTATEVMQRTEEKLRLLGPVLGRLHFELLKPLINRVFAIMARKGELPEDPPEELAGIDLKVHFSSMIARAQRASEADNIVRVMNVASPIAQLDPTLMDNINPDGFIRYLSDLFDVPAEVLRTVEDVEGIREQRQTQMQEMQRLEAQQMESQAAKNLGVQVPA